MDILLSSAGLLLFALPFVWIAWRIWIQAGRPIFFRQTRIGRGGNRFTILKFRTMTPAGEVFPFGRRLRDTAMDELPQLLHIFQGQMSFVGPRPLIPEELVELDKVPQGKRRLSIQPGLAGLAQLYDSKTPTLRQRLRWDLLYVDRCSLGLDLWIILRSVGVTLQGAWEREGPKVKAASKGSGDGA